jgi:DNA-directed RNA polymerase specialized sigma subunit
MTVEERNQLVLENDWVIKAIISKYSHLRNVDIDEMRSMAYLYMLKGAKKFDKSKGASASTYLYNWAQAGVREFLYENRSVHIPRNKINEYMKKKDEDKNLVNKTGLHAEISLDINNENETSNIKDRVFRQILGAITSDVNNVYSENETFAHVEHVVNSQEVLTPIERFTIVHRFGLMGEEPKTQQTIASLTALPVVKKLLGRSYSIMGINKAEHRATKKLQDNDMIKELLD